MKEQIVRVDTSDWTGTHPKGKQHLEHPAFNPNKKVEKAKQRRIDDYEKSLKSTSITTQDLHKPGSGNRHKIGGM